MAVNTKIEWTDHTWNPWHGCPDDGKRTPACANCYAEAWASRFGAGDFNNTITRTSDKTFYKPLNKNLYKPGDKVFVCSLSDFFHDAVPVELVREAYAKVILARPDLTWIFLTKRPENIKLDNWIFNPIPANHWLGVTAENQEQADIRILKLMQIPAAVRFVSCEPLFELINLPLHGCEHCGKSGKDGLRCRHCGKTSRPVRGGLDWVICGGESGPKARPTHPDFVRSLRDQCAATDTPFLFKQWGEWCPISDLVCREKTGNRFHWNAILHNRQEIDYKDDVTDERIYVWHYTEHDPKDDSEFAAYKVGKHKAGRELDGRLHDGYPTIKPTRCVNCPGASDECSSPWVCK